MTEKSATDWYRVSARILEKGRSVTDFPQEQVVFDTSVEKPRDVPGPAELLLTSLAACTLKNLERYSHILPFEYSEASIVVEGERQDAPPKFMRFRYLLKIKTSEPDHRIELLKKNVERYGTIYNTLVLAAPIEGRIERVT
jgi:uncharacterized OsmC-like protein